MRLWREIALSTAAVLLTLIVIDRALCLVYPAFKINADRFVPDEELGWKLRPNILLVRSGVRHNSLGYRGGEFRGGRPLIAFIGDSVTYSATSDENTFAALFQQLSGWTAYNFGVPLYGPLHYEKMLAKAAEFEPDLTVVGFFIGNDVWDCKGIRKDSRPRSNTGESARWSWSGIYRLLLFRGVVQLPAWGQNQEARSEGLGEDRFLEIEWRRAAVYKRDTFEYSWNCVEAALRRMVPHDPLVLVLPDEMQVNDRLWQTILSRARRPEAFDRDLPNTRIRNLTEGMGLRILDVTPLLRAETRRTFFRWDSHPNPLGNEIIAGALAEELRAGRHDVRLPEARREAALESYLRSFDKGPGSILPHDELPAEEPVFAWRPQLEDRCVAIWPAIGAQAELVLGGHPGRIEWRADTAAIHLDTPIDVESVDQINVILESRKSGVDFIATLSLYWAGSEESYAGKRSSWQGHGERIAGDRWRYHLTLKDDPDWRPPVSRIGLLVQPEADIEIALCSIIGKRLGGAGP